MERFQRDHRNQRQHFAIGYAHDVLVLRAGRKRSMEFRDFPTAAEAKLEYERTVRDHVREGWELISGSIDEAPPEQSHPQLVAKIREHPDEDDAYLVYADWLQAQGDPRGELIAVQAALGPRSAFPKVPAQEQLASLAREDAELARLIEVEAALAARYPTRLGGLASFRPDIATVWRNGFVESVRLRVSAFSRPPALAQVIRHPGFQFASEVELTLGSESLPGQPLRRPNNSLLQAPLNVLAWQEPPLPVKRLNVEASANGEPFMTELSWIWARYPALDSLSLIGTQPSLGYSREEGLLRLSLGMTFFSNAGLDWLQRARLVNLIALDIRNCRVPGDDGEIKARAAEWLEGVSLPSLRAIRVDFAGSGDQLWIALMRSRVIGQVDAVTLVGPEETLEGYLAQRRDALRTFEVVERFGEESERHGRRLVRRSR